MKTLLTGFGPFGNVTDNPSQLIVENLAERAREGQWPDLVADVLPTEFAGAGNRIAQLIREHRPERVICLGVAKGTGSIRLERVALNLDDTSVPDNAGVYLEGKKIVPDGPLAYWSTLPIEDMCGELQGRGIPANISNHAGTYVCNHVFYVARHEIELLGSSAPCGFIHLPDVARPSGRRERESVGLSLNVMQAAVELCLRAR